MDGENSMNESNESKLSMSTLTGSFKRRKPFVR